MLSRFKGWDPKLHLAQPARVSESGVRIVSSEEPQILLITAAPNILAWFPLFSRYIPHCSKVATRHLQHLLGWKNKGYLPNLLRLYLNPDCCAVCNMSHLWWNTTMGFIRAVFEKISYIGCGTVACCQTSHCFRSTRGALSLVSPSLWRNLSTFGG